MVTYIILSTFKMVTPYCQQCFVVKTQAPVRLIQVTDYAEQEFNPSMYQCCWLWVSGQVTMITIGKLALV